MEVISIPMVPTLGYLCTKLRIESPAYSLALESNKFRYTVNVQLGKLPAGENNIVKVKGLLSTKVHMAKESAARAAIIRVKNFYKFSVDDVNFDDSVDMREKLKEASWEIDGLKYELQLQQYNQQCMKAYWLEQVRDLHSQVSVLKAQLNQVNPAKGSTSATVESDPEEDNGM